MDNQKKTTQKSPKQMPLAGNKPGDRAVAHIRTAQRYAKPGNPNDIRKAVAHVSRALDYSAIKQQHFGANDDEEEVEAYVEKSTHGRG